MSGTVTSFVLEEPSCEREGKKAHVVFAEYAGARYESKAFTPIAATGHSYKKPVFTWDSDFHCKAVFDCGNENCRSQKIINCTVRKAILLEAGCEEKGKVEYVAAAEAPEQSSARKILVLKTPVVLKAVNVRSRSIYVKWNKNEKCSGTQMQYALSANFHNAKTKTYSGSKVVSKYITRLSKEKYYYVRVRSYKIVNKQKVYSGWSKTKKVKIVK